MIGDNRTKEIFYGNAALFEKGLCILYNVDFLTVAQITGSILRQVICSHSYNIVQYEL